MRSPVWKNTRWTVGIVEAQMALQLAERMVEQGREAAAKANLQLAKNHLELYSGLLEKGKSEHVTKLQKEITKLQSEIGRKDAAESIRGFWDRVASWFVRDRSWIRGSGIFVSLTTWPTYNYSILIRGNVDIPTKI